MSELQDPRFRVRRSRAKMGLGLFARLPIAKGNFILEYTGTRISTPIADALDTRYLFEIDEEWTIDGSPRSNTARYINHSCKPNCEAEIEKGKIMIYASRAIAPSEELTMDYGEEYFDEFIKPYGCRCRACAAKKGLVPIASRPARVTMSQ